MNNRNEKNKEFFSPCHIQSVSSPLEPSDRRTAEHENRFGYAVTEKQEVPSAMQKYNSII